MLSIVMPSWHVRRTCWVAQVATASHRTIWAASAQAIVKPQKKKQNRKPMACLKKYENMLRRSQTDQKKYENMLHDDHRILLSLVVFHAYKT